MLSLLQKWIDKRVEDYQGDLLRKYCEEVESMYAKMRGWRHDYHNHIQALQASMALGRYDDVNAYLLELNDDLTQVDTTVKTGRVMIDAILNGKMNIAAQNAIAVNVKAKIPDETPVTDVDLCAIIGNLLDNAIEENKRLPQENRFIRIYIGRKNTQFYLAFTNAAGKNTKSAGGCSRQKRRGAADSASSGCKALSGNTAAYSRRTARTVDLLPSC